MICDLVRSCYRRRIKYVKGDPTKTAVATWYRAAPTAKVFPGPMAFSSAIWDSVHPTLVDLGDSEEFAKSWYNGRRINRSDGTSFAGPAAFFLEGADVPKNLPRGFDGTPLECLRFPSGLSKGGQCLTVKASIGGKGLSGHTITTGPTPGIPCVNCSGTTPANVTITIAGCTGFAAVFNGTWIVPQLTACNWSLVVSPGATIFIARSPGGSWLPNIGVVAMGAANYFVSTADCVSPAVAAFTFGDNVHFPPTVSLVPGP